MLKIVEMVDRARYSEVLEDLITSLEGLQVLRLSYDSDWQGHVDIDVLLKDGRVFSYMYYYGSCSGCDEWEDRNLSHDEIKEVMLLEATFFDDLVQYEKWIELKNQKH